ncbi:hypothetical protein TSAR_004111 [Trichomalopsis sarcophagae]|uniref:Reverse transcriptase domain-containing protein n=1 Tax=Trichomalopsis sarcophagae TaxID=543379 RepID=A0A232EQ71_9HYME|nr:hypothetical protein TSAR_004111 [Trichomalopsis sarcophagae]
MTINRKFVTYNGDKISSLLFDIIEGLMQDTVHSPELFNIFTYNIPILFRLNKGNTYSVAFADDSIILVADKSPSVVESKLEYLVNKVNQHYSLWNLRINPSKCETILFDKPLRFLTSKIRTEIKNFKHKKVVKYLGVQLNYLLRLNIHVNTQLNKAKNAFRAHRRLYFNKSMPEKAKVICYLLLIRSILTYAVPVWASLAEKLRKVSVPLDRIREVFSAAETLNSQSQDKIIYKKTNSGLRTKFNAFFHGMRVRFNKDESIEFNAMI